MTTACKTHLVGVRSENTVVVCGSVSEFLFNLRRQLISVCLTRLARHSYAAKGVYTALERTVGLQTDDYFVFLVHVSGRIAGQRGDGSGIDIENPTHLSLKLEKALNLLHHFIGAFRRLRKKRAVTRIFLII